MTTCIWPDAALVERITNESPALALLRLSEGAEVVTLAAAVALA